MYKTLRTLFICLFIFFLPFGLYAQSSVKSAQKLISNYISHDNPVKAYCYGKYILAYYENETLPEDSFASINDSVTAYAKYLEENQKWDYLILLDKDLTNAPDEIKESANLYIKKAKKYFADLEAKKNELETEKKVKREEQKNQIREIKEMDKSFLKTNGSKNMEMIVNSYYEELNLIISSDSKNQEAEIQSNSGDNTITEKISKEDYTKSIFEDTKSSKNTIFLFIMFALIVLVFIAVLIVVASFAYKQYKINQEQMTNTLSNMEGMKKNSTATTNYPINLKIKLEDPVLATTNREEIVKLLNTCKQFGLQIDEFTGRKNATELVAELVYKISVHLGYSEPESRLFYAASLVYDIGFLNLDSKLLNSKKITSAEFETIKSHTTIGTNMVFFVDEKYRDLFKDAVNKHHENLNGTGYPNKLKEDEIPYIARVIRVVESYVALVSTRHYKEIHDRDYAINELQNSSKIYDQNIVKALIEII